MTESEIREALEALREHIRRGYLREDDKPRHMDFLMGFAAGLASRTPLVWSKEPPKVPGGYWRQPEWRSRHVIDITAGDIETENFTSWDGRWAGPIPEPEEPR